jgi:hypothetical protein
MDIKTNMDYAKIVYWHMSCAGGGEAPVDGDYLTTKDGEVLTTKDGQKIKYK